MIDQVSSGGEGSTEHASCVSRAGQGVLIRGESGSGKSDLALRLMDRGFALVADDRVVLRGGMAEPPDALRGMIEVRGVGILRVTPIFPVTVSLVVRLSERVPRLPEPVRDPVLGVPEIVLCAREASAVLKVELALACVSGEHSLAAGFVGQSDVV